MVRFPMTAGGVDVYVNGKKLGCIDKEGFFTDPVIGPKEFVKVSGWELRTIANKVDEVTS